MDFRSGNAWVTFVKYNSNLNLCTENRPARSGETNNTLKQTALDEVRTPVIEDKENAFQAQFITFHA